MAALTTVTATIDSPPTSSTVGSTAKPGSGSATRATPIGKRLDSASATTTAPRAPKDPTRAARPSGTPRRSMGRSPSARRVSTSSGGSRVARATACPTISSTTTPKAVAATAREAASGCIESLTRRVAAAWSATNTGPPVPRLGSFPSRSISSVIAARSTAGSTSTKAPSKFQSARGTSSASGAVARIEPVAFRSLKGTTSSYATPTPVTVSRMGRPWSGVATQTRPSSVADSVSSTTST